MLQLGVADYIWKPLEVVLSQRVGISTAGHDRGKGLAILQDKCAGKLPSPDHCVEQTAAIQERPVFAEGQLIDRISPECAANIEVGISIVC